MGRASAALASLLALLAVLVLPLAITSTWLREQVVDSGHYVSAVTPLHDDPEVRAAIIEEVRHLLPDAPTAAITQAVDLVLGSDGFEAIWVNGNRVGHRELIQILAQKPGAPVRVEIPLVDLSGSLGQLPPGVPHTISIDVVTSHDLTNAQRGYRLLDRLWIWPAIAWLALVVLAMLLPGGKRRATSILGSGSILVVALLAGGLLVGRSQVVGLGSRVHGDLVGDYWDALVHSLWITLAVVGIAAALALLARGIVGLLPGRTIFEE